MTPEEQAEADRIVWDERAKKHASQNQGPDLYSIYAGWSYKLHRYVSLELGRHVDVEYFPQTYSFKVYSGRAQEGEIGGFGPLPVTVPGLSRPHGEEYATFNAPRPEDNPTQDDLDEAFRKLCLAAAQVLGIDPAKRKKHALKDKTQAKKLRNKKTDEGPSRKR